jgi:hypothetical protein
MNYSSNQIGLTQATVYDISAADLAGANSGQRPDLLAKTQAIFRTPDQKLYAANAARNQLVAAAVPVTVNTDPLTGKATGLVGPDGSAISLGGGMSTGRTITGAQTAALTDANTIVYTNSASAVALTIPNDATVAWAVDTVIGLYQAGAGISSFAAGSGVTLRSPAGIAASVQYAHIYVRKVATNEWALV